MSDQLENLKTEDISIGDRPLNIPSELPILPLRDTVLFPNSFMPLAVARESSVRLIDDAIANGKLIAVFTQRDASARTFDHVFSLATPRDPNTWATVEALPVPAWTMDAEAVGKALSTLGKGMGPTLIAMAKDMGVKLSPELDDPGAALTPELVVPFLRAVAGHFFPGLAGDAQEAD